MKFLNPTRLSLFALAVIIWSSCSSGKSAYESGNYYDAVITSVNRLRRNSDSKKSSETLRAAYPMAVRYYEDKANAAVLTNTEFKWREVVQHYTTLQSMSDEIQRSPGALQVVPNPNNYQSKLADARQKAAEESYNAGIMAMGRGDRAGAKRAHQLFVDSNNYAPGYKDVLKKMEEARWAATVKVAVEPIPVVAKNYALDAHYFDSKLNEYLRSNQTNEFVRYYKLADAKSQGVTPDHIVQLSFEEFSIGQVYVNEKEAQVERDSVVVAYAYTDTKGNLLQRQTDVPKILPVAGGVTVVGAKTGSATTSGKTEDKKVTETKAPVADQGKKEEKPADKPVEKPAEDKKSADVTKTDDKVTGDKNSEERKPEDEKKSDEKNQGDKKEEKPEGKITEEKKSEESKPEEKKPEDEKKSDDKNQGDKKEEKPHDKNDDGKDNGGEKKTDSPSDNKTDNNGEKKDDAGKPEDKVTICHQPGGNPSERKTLTVPQSAVKAHLAHGDVMGECKVDRKDDKGKDSNTKGKDGGGEGMAMVMPTYNGLPVMIASNSNNNVWYLFDDVNTMADTTKVFGKVKATVHHYKKTITSRGVLNFRIVDAKTKAVISEQRMPSEFIWVSEWLTYNGDSRALSPEQEKLARQKEMQPPTNQDLFTEFSKPLFDQISNKITEFYRNY